MRDTAPPQTRLGAGQRGTRVTDSLQPYPEYKDSGLRGRRSCRITGFFVENDAFKRSVSDIVYALTQAVPPPAA